MHTKEATAALNATSRPPGISSEEAADVVGIARLLTVDDVAALMVVWIHEESMLAEDLARAFQRAVSVRTLVAFKEGLK